MVDEISQNITVYPELIYVGVTNCFIYQGSHKLETVYGRYV